MKIYDFNERLLQFRCIGFLIEFSNVFIQIVYACHSIPDDRDEHELAQHEKRANSVTGKGLDHINEDDTSIRAQMKRYTANRFILICFSRSNRKMSRQNLHNHIIENYPRVSTVVAMQICEKRSKIWTQCHRRNDNQCR